MSKLFNQRKLDNRVERFESVKATLKDSDNVIVTGIGFSELNNFGYFTVEGPIVPESMCNVLQSNEFAISKVEYGREKKLDFLTVHFRDTLGVWA
jgi:hypothetical protein